jgi:hypothetical protein
MAVAAKQVKPPQALSLDLLQDVSAPVEMVEAIRITAVAEVEADGMAEVPAVRTGHLVVVVVLHI